MTVPYSVATPVVPSCVAYISVICLSLLLTAVTRNLAAPYVAFATVTKAVCEVELVVVSLPSRVNVSPVPTTTDPLTSIPPDPVCNLVLPLCCSAVALVLLSVRVFPFAVIVPSSSIVRASPPAPMERVLVEGLYVRDVSVSRPCVPVAPSTKVMNFFFFFPFISFDFSSTFGFDLS